VTIEDFWNRAFLAALTRLPAEQAAKEADTATAICINHWHEHTGHWEPNYLTRWQDQKIGCVPLLVVSPEPRVGAGAQAKKGARRSGRSKRFD